MRLFLALEPDAAARARLADVLTRVQSSLDPDLASGLHWSRADAVHVTLHFLGEVGEDRLPALLSSLGRDIDRAPFSVATGGLGAFPVSGPPRVVWVALAEGAKDAAAVHDELARRLTSLSLILDARPLSPHLTLARVRDPRNRAIRVLRTQLKEIHLDPIRWRVDRVTLFRSHFSSSSPPAYEPLHHIELAHRG